MIKFDRIKSSIRANTIHVKPLWPCPNYRYGDSPTHPTSKMAIFTSKMRDVLKRMKNQFSDFDFLRYG